MQVLVIDPVTALEANRTPMSGSPRSWTNCRSVRAPRASATIPGRAVLLVAAHSSNSLVQLQTEPRSTSRSAGSRDRATEERPVPAVKLDTDTLSRR